LTTPFWQSHGFGDFGHDVGGAWRLRRSLDDDRAAGEQRWGELVRDQQDGAIPGNNGGDDTHGFSNQQSEFPAAPRNVRRLHGKVSASPA